jgi:hypothetical protein
MRAKSKEIKLANSIVPIAAHFIVLSVAVTIDAH